MCGWITSFLGTQGSFFLSFVHARERKRTPSQVEQERCLRVRHVEEDVGVRVTELVSTLQLLKQAAEYDVPEQPKRISSILPRAREKQRSACRFTLSSQSGR